MRGRNVDATRRMGQKTKEIKANHQHTLYHRELVIVMPILIQLTEARKGEETKEIACKETTTRGDEEKRAEMKEKNSGKKRKLKGRNDNTSKG